MTTSMGHTLGKSSNGEFWMEPLGWIRLIGAAGTLHHIADRKLYQYIELHRYKALLSAPPLPATPRPAKVSPPPVNFTALAGIYNNNGYGRFELCLISPKNPSASRSCQALSSNISTILPGTIDPKIPTFMGEWNSPSASHVRITHFNGNLFNVSAFTINVIPSPYR
jgi:hypothetical protein